MRVVYTVMVVLLAGSASAQALNPNSSVSGVGPIGTTGPISGVGPGSVQTTGPIPGVGAGTVPTTNPDVASKYQTAVISRADCEKLAANVPAGGNANYQPGVSATGKAVAPADLGGVNPMPGIIAIPLTLPLSNYASNLPPAVADSQIYASALTLNLATGQVMLNGQPVDSNTQSQISAACLQKLQGN